MHFPNLQMLNLYSDPHGKNIFNKSNPSTSAEANKPTPTPQVGSIHTQCESEWETVARNREEALKNRDKRISELERELSLIKVRRPCSCLICDDRKGGEAGKSFLSSATVFSIAIVTMHCIVL